MIYYEKHGIWRELNSHETLNSIFSSYKYGPFASKVQNVYGSDWKLVNQATKKKEGPTEPNFIMTNI